MFWSWILMRRFSFSFQHETPTSLQIEATELLVKAHDPSFPNGSDRDFLTPWRHITSSSMAEPWGERKTELEAKRTKKKTMIFMAWGFGLMGFGYFVNLGISEVAERKGVLMEKRAVKGEKDKRPLTVRGVG
ncbi:hypothetical protein PanWU01x14_250660 [Parasponia andersonii]|uniref:Transmembrane protein n=1 Tax=Parasponia andersonii TaxID=3476 RepID=A0A2P5BCK7_PARAD|nr:hypothetical protein PanWU01x14_250660 [Parasponia andersonii]